MHMISGFSGAFGISRRANAGSVAALMTATLLAADDGAWLNDYPFGDLGGGMDEHSIRPRCRCRCSRLKGIGVKQPNGHGEGAMGYVRRDRGRPSRHETSVAALDEAGGGLCCRQLTGIFAA